MIQLFNGQWKKKSGSGERGAFFLWEDVARRAGWATSDSGACLVKKELGSPCCSGAAALKAACLADPHSAIADMQSGLYMRKIAYR